jgi:hypothetical protein
MGNDKYISFEGTPHDASQWAESVLADVAHATAVAPAKKGSRTH